MAGGNANPILILIHNWHFYPGITRNVTGNNPKTGPANVGDRDPGGIRTSLAPGKDPMVNDYIHHITGSFYVIVNFLPPETTAPRVDTERMFVLL
jgi:hypothetical protein